MVSKIVKITTYIPLIIKKNYCKLAMLWRKVKEIWFSIRVAWGSALFWCQSGSESTWNSDPIRIGIKTMPIHNTGIYLEFNKCSKYISIYGTVRWDSTLTKLFGSFPYSDPQECVRCRYLVPLLWCCSWCACQQSWPAPAATSSSTSSPRRRASTLWSSPLRDSGLVSKWISKIKSRQCSGLYVLDT